MFNRSQNIRYLLSLVPGKRRLGMYRFLPVFFCIGGVMEWIMINVRIGKETFYCWNRHSKESTGENKCPTRWLSYRESRIESHANDVYRRKRSEREYQQKITDGLIVSDEPAAK